MYIDKQIRTLLDAAIFAGKDQWINIKSSREKAEEYKNSQKEFTLDDLVGMVMLSDAEVISKGQKINALRFKLYFNPSMMDEIFQEMEAIFKGHVMINVRQNANGKFVIDKTSKTTM